MNRPTIMIMSNANKPRNTHLTVVINENHCLEHSRC